MGSPPKRTYRFHREETPLTLSVPHAGWRYLGIGPKASYDAASSGRLPTVLIAGKLRVPVHLMEEMLKEVRCAAPL